MLRLSDLREDKDLKHYDIAKLLNVTRSQYTHLELGNSKITHDKLIILANFYNTSTDYILGRTNEINSHKKNDKEIKSHLKKLRKSQHLKESDIAKIIGISQAQYSAIENNNYKIRNDKLNKLADFYNTSVDYILGLTNESKPYPKPPFEIK